MTAPLTPPAFPAVYPDPVHSGISKREYFAAAALAGLCANPSLMDAGSRAEITWCSLLATKLADEVMAELSMKEQA